MRLRQLSQTQEKKVCFCDIFHIQKHITFVSMKDLYSFYYLVTVVYTVVFTTLGIVLLLARVPREGELRNYISARRYFSLAFLFLGFFGLVELLVGLPLFVRASGYSYKEIYPMIAVSMIHAWLNGYAYLLMLNPPLYIRRKVLLFGRYGIPAILFSGALALLLPSFVSRYFIWLLDGVYVGAIGWMFFLCRKVYNQNVSALANYYDQPTHIGWMNGVINISLVLVFFNVMQYHIPIICIPLRIANTLFYIYFFIRIIDYIPLFLSIERVKVSMQHTNQSQTEKSFKTIRYPNNMGALVARWVEKCSFCEENLTITDVAKQMNTNRNYLSAYLNHCLGVTYSQWLNTLRIEHAKFLICKNRDKNLGEISVMIGIPEPYNFSRWFKLVTGMSPQQWMDELDN